MRSGGKDLALELEAKGYGWLEARNRRSQGVAMAQVAERVDTLAPAFEAFRRDPAFGAGGLGPAREAAFARFLSRDFRRRGTRSGATRTWRRSRRWRSNARRTPRSPRAAAEPFLFAAEIPHRVVLVNGRWSRALSSLAALPAGVTVRNLRDVPAPRLPTGSSGSRRRSSI